MTLRSMLYRLASLLGDVNAVKKNKVPQRLVRKALHKRAGRFINGLIK
jgi:hypothetical protein